MVVPEGGIPGVYKDIWGRDSRGMVHLFIILIVVMVLQLYTYVSSIYVTHVEFTVSITPQ